MTISTDEKEQHIPKRPSLSLTREARFEEALEFYRDLGKDTARIGHLIFTNTFSKVAEEALKS